MNNTRGIFSLQGNKLLFWEPSIYIAIAIAFLLVGGLYLIRRRIFSWGVTKQKQKIWIFKNIDGMLQFVGIIGIIYTALRITWLIIINYIFKWELLQLHLCRMHLLIIFLLLTFRKKNLIKYIVYFSILGAFFGLLFGSLTTPYDQTGLLKPGSIWLKHNIKFMSPGFDTIYFWDFILSHIFLFVFPTFVFIVSGETISTKNLYTIFGIYYLVAIVMWLTNYGSSFLSNLDWKANNWYMSTNEVNDYSNALGPLTMWPQNIVTVPLVAIFGAYLMHIIYLWNFGSGSIDLRIFIKDHYSFFKYKVLRRK